MLPEEVTYQFIDKESPYYNDTVELRYRIFYQPHGTPLTAVFDDREDISLHLAAIYQEKVVGYIRLTIKQDVGQITQFVVEPAMQGKGYVAQKLFNILITRAKAENVKKLEGEIRLPVAKAAAIYGFTVSDEIIYSKKTGLPHRKIEKYI